MKALLAIVLLSFSGVLHAQEESAEFVPADPKALPTGRLLKRTPAFSQCTIYFSYKKEAPTAGSPGAGAKTPEAAPPASQVTRPTKITVTKTAPVFHTVIYYPTGRKTDAWFNGQVQAVLLPGASSFSIVSLDEDAPDKSLAINYNQTDFQDLDWISLQNFIGRKQQYLVFQEPGSKRVAYIDNETRLPVRLQIGLEIRDYQIQEIPHTMQTFPAEVHRSIETIQSQIRAVTSGGPRPY